MPTLSAGLQLTQAQQQILAPQQQFALKLLRMTAQELLDEASLAAEENPLLEQEPPAEPALEAAAPGARLEEEGGAAADAAEASESRLPEDRGPLENAYSGWSGAGGDDEGEPWIERVPARRTLRDDLLEELGTLSVAPLERELASCLIDEIDERGFITAPIEAIAADYERFAHADLAAWRRALALVQTFDPAGVGTAGPAAALALQARRAAAEGRADPLEAEAAARLVEHALKAVASGSRKALLAAIAPLGGGEALLDRALALLKTLRPYPASEYGAPAAPYVVADLVALERAGRWHAALNPAAQPGLRLSELAQSAQAGRGTPFARYLDEARRLIAGIEARQTTLLRTAEFAVSRQQAFFREGAGALAPLRLADAAEALDLAESTISRAVAGKFIQSPQGTVELRRLFPAGGVPTKAPAGSAAGAAAPAAASPARIRARIAELIAGESREKPLSDQALTDLLRQEGYDITRRTVAKYRDLEGLPSARLRAGRR